MILLRASSACTRIVDVAVDLSRPRPDHRLVAPLQVGDRMVRRLRPQQRDLGLVADPRQPGQLAHVEIDARRLVELRRHQRLAAHQQDRRAVGRGGEHAIHRDQPAGARLVGRNELGAELALQVGHERAHIGVIAAARAAHGVEANLLALEEGPHRLVGGARRRGRGGERAQHDRDQQSAASLVHRHRTRRSIGECTAGQRLPSRRQPPLTRNTPPAPPADRRSRPACRRPRPGPWRAHSRNARWPRSGARSARPGTP